LTEEFDPTKEIIEYTEIYAKVSCENGFKVSHYGVTCIANNIYEIPEKNYFPQVVNDLELYIIDTG
jgi:hypothetical protein